MDTIERKELREKVSKAHSIAFDKCHKIYINMDAQQTEKSKGYGYSVMLEAEYSTPNLMYSTALLWYKNSCCLKFVDAIETGKNGEPDFYTVVAQR